MIPPRLLRTVLLGSCLLCLALVNGPSSLAAEKDAAPAAPRQRPRAPKSLPRVVEMEGWLAKEQHADGGWAFRLRLLAEYHLHDAGPSAHYVKQTERLWPSNVADTAMAALALLRAGHRPGVGPRGRNLERAADFLYARVQASSATWPTVDVAPTPLTARIGPQADAFLALLFFSELKAAPGVRGFRYQAAIDRLLEKVLANQRDDGSWDDEADGASHAPLLGHALGVWALESCARGGEPVPPDALAKAGRYALSPEAERREWRRNGRWKKDRRVVRPRWLRQAGVDDDEPVNHELYVMAARLAVLYQADRSNRAAVARETARLEALDGGPSKRDLQQLRALRAASATTRRSLDQGRDLIAQTWVRAHPRDASPSPAPSLFTGEDFLSCLLIVDAMAERQDVERWFVHVAQRLMSFQDLDGGLRTQQHITCKHPHVRDCCFPPFPKFPDCEALSGCECHKHDPRAGVRPGCMLPQFCIYQKFWCSRDRPFITSAGLMILTADTPYRDAVLGFDKPVKGKPVIR